MAKTYNLFISHSWAYADAYEKLIKLLQEKPYFTFNNYSVPKDDPIHRAPNSAALYNAIKKQMAPCSVVLILAGVYATYSTWIKKEITIATDEFSTRKPIVGIRPWASEAVSTVVQENASELVGWNTDSIVTAIRDLA